MAQPKIIAGSVTTIGNNTHMKVVFIRDNGEESHPQNYEVASTDEEKIYAELAKGAASWEKMTSTKAEGLGKYDVDAVVPTLVEGEALDTDAEIVKAKEAKVEK